jgi:hypothetical protein
MTHETLSAETNFTISERDAVYKAIFACRDGRRFFSAPIPGDAIERRLARRPSRTFRGALCSRGILS